VIHDVLELLRDALRDMPKGAYRSTRKRIEVLGEAIARDRSFLDVYPTCLFQSLSNSCYWYDSREARDRYWTLAHGMDIWEMASLFSGSLSSLVESWKDSPIHRCRPWLRALSPPQHRLRSHLASEQKMPWRFSSRIASSTDGTWLAWNGLQYRPDEQWLWIWNRRTNVYERIRTDGYVYDVTISPSGNVLAVALPGHVDLYLLENDALITHPFLTLRPETQKVISRAAFAEDSELLAVGTFGGEVFIYSPENPDEPLRVQSSHTKATALTWQRSDTLFVGHADGTVCRLDVPSGEVETLPIEVQGPVNDLLLLTHEELLAASGHDMPSMERDADLKRPQFPSAIYSWNSRTGAQNESSTEHKSQVNALCRRHGRREYFSSSGSWHPIWNLGNAIYRWSEGSTYPSQCFEDLASAVVAMCYIAAEETLFSMSHEGVLQEWKFGDDCEGDFRCRWHKGDIAFIKFSPCGRYFATACERDAPLIGRVSDGSQVSQLNTCEQSLYSMAFFHSGKFVLTAPAEPDRQQKESYFVRLWDVRSGNLLGETGPHEQGVYMVAVSDDDRFILTGTGDFNFGGRNIQTMYLWDARTLRLVDQCGGRAWSNADRVSDMEVDRMLRSNGVRMPQRPPFDWQADRVGEFATAVKSAIPNRDNASGELPLTWLPIVPTDAETPYAWHPSEPIVAIATGPFLQLFRLENCSELK
jgi:WD40 repeat protein